MALFEGGKFNKAALGPLQNLFNKSGSGGGAYTGPYATGQGPSNNEFWDEGFGAMEDLESDAGNWWQNFRNRKSKQPLINKEDQSMRLPNFLFPKQNPKSILNLPGKLFNKENMEKVKTGYSNIFGEGGLLSKADFGGVRNPWALEGAPQTVEPTNEDQGGFIDPATYGQEEVSDTPIIDKIKGGLGDAYKGFMNLDLSQYGNSNDADSTGVGLNVGNYAGNYAGNLMDESQYSSGDIKYNMSGSTPPSEFPKLDAVKDATVGALDKFKNFDFEQFIGEDGQPITDPEEIKRILEGNLSSGQNNNNLQNNNFWNQFQNLAE